MKTEMTAEKILDANSPGGNSNGFYHSSENIVAFMHEFADQRYTPAEVMAIMEKVREECAERVALLHHDGVSKTDRPITYFQNGADNIKPYTANIYKVNLNKYLTK